MAFDTMVASYLLDAGERNHNLDELASAYLDHTTIKIDELIGTGKNQKRMDEVPRRRDHALCRRRRRRALRLVPMLDAAAARSEARRRCSTTLELPLIDVLVELEYNGIRIDCRRARRAEREYGEQLARLEARDLRARRPRVQHRLAQAARSEILFDELKLPVLKKTKTGAQHRRRSARRAGAAASAAGQDHRVSPVRQAEEHLCRCPARSWSIPQTGRVHASFNQVVAATGRLSSQRSEPAKHPHPHRERPRNPLGVSARPARLAAAGGRLFADRAARAGPLLAATRRCAQAFADDEDIHARVASADLRRAAGRSDQRHAARGQGRELRRHLRPKSVRPGQAPGHRARPRPPQFIDAYFAALSGRRAIPRRRHWKTAASNGYVSTILGRRRAITRHSDHGPTTASATCPNAPRSTRSSKARPPT